MDKMTPQGDVTLITVDISFANETPSRFSSEMCFHLLNAAVCPSAYKTVPA